MTETLRDVMQDLYDTARLPDWQREQYEKRITRAVWHDRLEVMEVADETRDWVGGSEASDDERGGWCA